MSLYRPLADEVRPTGIEEVVGQKHLLGEGKPIYQMIKNKHPSSIILFGTTGVGKTTIASAIASSIDMPFVKLNGVTDGKRDIDNAIKKAKDEQRTYLLFIDEIHRLTKTQSEPLLPAIENGTIILVASTTESVYHSLPSGILSRCAVYELESLTTDEIKTGLDRIIHLKESKLNQYSFKIDEEVLYHLADTAGGDMRTAINNLELVITTNCLRNSEESVHITTEIVEELTNKKTFGYNGEDSKYDLLSAYQKSIRGSDADASIYYLAMLLETGDLTLITRRLGIIAFEDIGLADPNTWQATISAIKHAEQVGMPEARIPLANATILLALSPKSDTAYKALDKALGDVKSGRKRPVPRHLRDGHYQSASDRGNGVGYLYPHHYKTQRFGGWVAQQYLPDDLVKKEYYTPKQAGKEIELGKMYEIIAEQQAIINQES